MRKLFYTLSAFILFPLFASPAKAQRVELFGGYSYAQINPGGFETQNASGTGTHFSLSGWEVSGAVNANRWIGLVADFAGYPGTKAVDVLTAEHLRYYTYMAGPQVRLRGVGPFTCFAHGLVGAAHSNNDIPILTANFKETRLAYAAGGGVDISMGKTRGASRSSSGLPGKQLQQSRHQRQSDQRAPAERPRFGGDRVQVLGGVGNTSRLVFRPLEQSQRLS